ncbi:MAG: hypothetical protein ACTHNU_02380 [Gaiellales bacterium]
MQRGQASVEYLLLISALLLGICLLVRFETPVEAIARSVVHALEGRRPHPGPATPRRHPHRPPTHRRHACRCPLPNSAQFGPIPADRRMK